MGEINVNKAIPEEINITLNEDITIMGKRGEDKKEYKSEVNLNNLILPIKKWGNRKNINKR